MHIEIYIYLHKEGYVFVGMALLVCLSVFFCEMLTVTQGRHDSILVVIWINVWMKEVSKGLFIIALLSNTEGALPWI